MTEVYGDDDVTIPKTVHFEDESETSEDVREYRIHRKSGQKLLPVTDIPNYSYTLSAQHSFTNLTFDCGSTISQPCRRTPTPPFAQYFAENFMRMKEIGPNRRLANGL